MSSSIYSSLFGERLQKATIEEYEKYLQGLNNGTASQMNQMNQMNQSILGIGNNAVLGTNKIFKGPIPIDPNTQTEMAMSLETAHDMWRVRWGEDWVKTEDVEDAADGLNWGRLAYRLQRIQLLESDPTTNYYKLIPNTRWK